MQKISDFRSDHCRVRSTSKPAIHLRIVFKGFTTMHSCTFKVSTIRVSITGDLLNIQTKISLQNIFIILAKFKLSWKENWRC